MKALKDYNNTSINSKIPSLYTLAQGDIDTAYNTVYNLLSFPAWPGENID